MQNQLIPVNAGKIGNIETLTVNARDLHGFLQVRSQFSNWIQIRIKQYGFTQGVDFSSLKKTLKAEKGYKTSVDYTLTLDMGKELAMVERNDMEKPMNDAKTAGAASAVERRVSVPDPVMGLTFRKGKREANVHAVKDGIVFFGVYLDGEDLPSGAYQATMDEWDRMATQAVEHGAEVFTMVRANV